MLQCAVRRSRTNGPNFTRPKHTQSAKRGKPNRHHNKASIGTDTDKFSYVICDARSGGFYVQHVSTEFEGIFGCDASECTGKKASELLGTALSTSTLNKVIAARGLTEEQANDAIQRMSKAVETSCILPSGRSPLSLLVNLRNSKDGRELFVCEMTWHKMRHPVLGWSYHVGLQRDVSEISSDISVGELLEAACDDLSYEQICRNWNSMASSRGLPPLSEKMDLCSDKFHAVAEQVWKDEVAKGLKGKGSNKRADAETSSIWSRSTASTLASDKDANDLHTSKDKVKGKSTRPHHLGALIMQQSECFESNEPLTLPLALPGQALGVPEQSAQDDSDSWGAWEDIDDAQIDAQSEGFKSISDHDPWQDGGTPVLTASVPRFDLDSCSSSEVTDPVQHLQHVAKNGLDRLKAPFVIAAPTCEGCPIVLRSAGFEHLAIAEDAQNGKDLRQVLQPSNIRALNEWRAFCETVVNGDFWGIEGVALLGDWDFELPAGELAFVRCSRTLGHPTGSTQYLVYAKQVELDDWPFLLALCSCLPEGDDMDGIDDACAKAEFDKLSTQMDDVVSALASHFFYLAPMRRQNFVA